MLQLGCHPCWQNLIEEAGIYFEPIGPDIDIEKEAAIIRGKIQILYKHAKNQ